MNLMETHFPYHVGPTFRLSADAWTDRLSELAGLYHMVNQSFLTSDDQYIPPRIAEILRNRQRKSWRLLAKPLDRFLRQLHQDKENLVIFVSDHGDNFGDQDWFYHFSNVTDAGIGLKMKNGAFRQQRAIVVYVSRKIPTSELPANALLPREIEGVPVDVQEELDPGYFLLSQGENLDLTRARPLRSGLTISTSAASDRGGTLGCFATRNSDEKKVLLSNYHVLFRNRAMPDPDDGKNRVYQPVEGEHNQIAVVADDSGHIGGALDCALAVLGEEGSCICCKHTIPHENKVGTTPLVGVASAQVGEKVFKMGAKSGHTVGKVVSVDKDINGPVDYSDYWLPAGDSFTFSNLIMIVFWDEAADDFDPTQSFGQGGDSGSVVYNENNEIIGLYFGSHFNPATGRHFAFACHIDLVETALGVTVPGTRNISAAPPGPALAALDDPVSGDNIVVTAAPGSDQVDAHLAAWWQEVEPQLLQLESGRKALSLIRLHGYEIMRLINHRREVTVTWQRGKGPAFVAAAARSARHDDYCIPREIDGATATALAASMASVLVKHGSEELREAVQTNLPWFLALMTRLQASHQASARHLPAIMAEIDAKRDL
jgi:hypothetical protein